MEVHYFIELWTLRTLNILQLTYYWCWITHVTTRIGLCTRKVVLELCYYILPNIHIFRLVYCCYEVLACRVQVG